MSNTVAESTRLFLFLYMSKQGNSASTWTVSCFWPIKLYELLMSLWPHPQMVACCLQCELELQLTNQLPLFIYSLFYILLTGFLKSPDPGDILNCFVRLRNYQNIRYLIYKDANGENQKILWHFYFMNNF